VRYGSSEVVELLLFAQAEPSHRDAERRTPMDLAEAEARSLPSADADRVVRLLRDPGSSQST